ncbi:hypothetical protein PTKIN_Ptkin04bG0001700 [Pterospermum kingtungense]
MASYLFPACAGVAAAFVFYVFREAMIYIPEVARGELSIEDVRKIRRQRNCDCPGCDFRKTT